MPHASGVRVYFRRTEAGTGGSPARLEAEHGTLRDVVHAPDGLGVSVVWANPGGVLRCGFPYGGEGEYRAGGPLEKGVVRYVYVHEDGVRVTGRLPKGCPLQPEVELRVEPADATIETETEGIVTATGFRPPRDERGMLRKGVYRLFVVTGQRRVPFLLGIDADGIVAALSGYVENW